MINCYKCYHCKHHANVLYCPFFDLEECFRGKHKMILPKNEKLKLKPVEKVHIKFSNTPQAIAGKCYKHRKYIFECRKKGMPYSEIGKRLGIVANSIYCFVNKTLHRNGLEIWELDRCIID